MKYIISSLIITSTFAHADFDETKIQAPLKDSNVESLTSTICRTRPNNLWDICYSQLDNNVESANSFRFSNDGPNIITPKTGMGVGRDFEFLFQDQARSDLGLLVWDMPDEVESHGHLKLMMFFPRKNLPAIRESNILKNTLTVTLPNGEQINFNESTKEITGGVLLEAPMAQDKSGNGLEPKITYTGNGVVLWAHRLNDYPVGLYSAKSNANQPAYFYKKGYKLCTVKASDLWYTDNAKGGNVYFNKNFVTDAPLNEYVEKKCGFSIL